jgi:hypothetical protein
VAGDIEVSSVLTEEIHYKDIGGFFLYNYLHANDADEISLKSRIISLNPNIYFLFAQKRPG